MSHRFSFNVVTPVLISPPASSPVLSPAEGGGWEEGPLALPLHGPAGLHHAEAQVGVPAAQLHEPVSTVAVSLWGTGCLSCWGWSPVPYTLPAMGL